MKKSKEETFTKNCLECPNYNNDLELYSRNNDFKIKDTEILFLVDNINDIDNDKVLRYTYKYLNETMFLNIVSYPLCLCPPPNKLSYEKCLPNFHKFLEYSKPYLVITNNKNICNYLNITLINENIKNVYTISKYEEEKVFIIPDIEYLKSLTEIVYELKRESISKKNLYKKLLNKAITRLTDILNTERKYKNQQKRIVRTVGENSEFEYFGTKEKININDYLYNKNNNQTKLLVNIQNHNRVDYNKFYLTFKDEQTRKNEYLIIDGYDIFIPVYNKIGFKQEDSDMLLNIESIDFIENRNDIKFDKELDYYLDKPDNIALYEGDVRIPHRLAIDYNKYINNEPILDLDVLYFDIEVDTKDYRGFPRPERAEFPINAISFKYNEDNVYVYYLKPRNFEEVSKNIKEPEGYRYKYFNSEKELLENFLYYVYKTNIDIYSGWNVDGFDIPYIFNRVKKVFKNEFDSYISLLSPVKKIGNYNKKINEPSLDPTEEKYQKPIIFGRYVVDQLSLYKRMTQNKEPSYKLSYISTKYLGEDKVAYEGTLSNLYINDLNTFLLYSAKDAALLQELEQRFKHIKLQFEFIKVCSSTWETSETTLGKCDPLLISYCNDLNVVCRNKIPPDPNKTEVIPGGYVKYPTKGLYNWVVDFDFTSLYPSLIRSYNIGPDTCLAKVIDNDSKSTISDTIYRIIYDNENVNFPIKLEIDPIYPERKYETLMDREEFDKFMEDNDGILNISGLIYKGHNIQKSMLCKIMEDIFSLRERNKNLMKDAKREKDDIEFYRYNCKQMGYKILANSLYGALVTKYFRLFNNDLGKSITLAGQEVTNFVIHHISKHLNENVDTVDPYFFYDENKNTPYIIYGDTDSLFVDLGSKKEKE